MGKKRASGAKRLDKYYHLAKEQGYRARSAFKLKQLDNNYHFLSSSTSVIDLCAAPGGWLQICRQNMPVDSLIIGIDLVSIKSIPKVFTLVEDITKPSCNSTLKNLLKQQGYDYVDLVLHDGSPNVGGVWLSDSYQQNELTLASLALATSFLRRGGTFVTKIFRSSDYNSLLWVFNQLFGKVVSTKPLASRNSSAEIYTICTDYYQPSHIDTHLLDPSYVFKEISSNSTLISSKAQGYLDDGTIPGYQKKSFADFVTFSQTKSFLLSTSTITLSDSKSQELLNQLKLSENDKEELLALCQDIRVLNKSDQQKLLGFRQKSIKIQRKNQQPQSDKDKVTSPSSPISTSQSSHLSPPSPTQNLPDSLPSKSKSLLFRKDMEPTEEDPSLFSLSSLYNLSKAEDSFSETDSEREKDIIDIDDKNKDQAINKLETDLEQNYDQYKRKAQKTSLVNQTPHSSSSVITPNEISNNAETFDPDDRLATMALGLAFIKPSRKRQIIDDSYNRYSVDADEVLPNWFFDDEKKYRKPLLSLPEMDNLKGELTDLNARPLKKISEAKARKKLRTISKLNKIQKKMHNITDSELPDDNKIKNIQKILKKNKKKPAKRRYIVSHGQKGKTKRTVTTGKKSKSKKGKFKNVYVDRRMKKDQRSQRSKK